MNPFVTHKGKNSILWNFQACISDKFRFSLFFVRGDFLERKIEYIHSNGLSLTDEKSVSLQ